VQVPLADTSTYLAPVGVSDEALLMLADILPTGYEVGVLNGAVGPGQVVAVVGVGPIGLSAIMGLACIARPTSSLSTWPTAVWMPPSGSERTSSSTTAPRTRSRWCRS
jgi:D-arabinose 1-dehydrogenase-like Zn-dependent alcohol dehydrogenase